MRQEGRYDRRDDERRSEDGEWRRDDPQDDWDGHGKGANDEHGPRRDHTEDHFHRDHVGESVGTFVCSTP